MFRMIRAQSFSGVLTGQAEHPLKAFRANVLEANEADAGDGVTVVEFRPERCRQLTMNHGRLDPEVGNFIHVARVSVCSCVTRHTLLTPPPG